MTGASSSEIVAEARALVAEGRLAEAFRRIKSAVLESPDDLALLMEFAGIYRAMGLLDRAEQAYRQVVDLAPNAIAALNNIGVIRGDLGDAAGADAWYEKAIAQASANPTLASNRLYNAQFVPGVTARSLFPLHRAWDQRHGTPWRNRWSVRAEPQDPTKRLKIGFLSGDFARHPIAFFVLPLFRAIDRSQCEVHAFVSGTRRDKFSAAFKQAADGWHELGDLTDDEVAALIEGTGIDILIDLAGHTLNNRLPVFARKPAPVQMSWAGYVGTTGMAAMDYVIADRHQAPPEDDANYTERIIRLPHSYVPYDPPATAPGVAPLPALQNGIVTFGGMHNPAKINDPVMRLWASVLARVPGSIIRLKYRGLDAPGSVARIHAAFASAGIAPDRVQLSGFAPPDELLAAYAAIDIALDAMPYSGGLTTCEALWMGVPVLTLRGASFAGRHATSYLSTLGLTDLIARSETEFVDRAIALATDRARLEHLRGGLRERMRASPLLDYAAFAADFMSAMRLAWTSYCRARS